MRKRRAGCFWAALPASGAGWYNRIRRVASAAGTVEAHPARPMTTPCPSLRLLVLVAAFAVGAGARAQSHLVSRPGPFVTVDLIGGPFQIGLERKVAGGAVGYRVGRGLDFALRVEHADDLPDLLPERGLDSPGRTLLGAEAALAFGPERAPWQASGAAGAAWAGRSDLVFFDGGGSAFRGGRRLAEFHGVASLARYVRVADGPVTVLLGGGGYAEVRRLTAETTVYGAGGPDEQAVRSGAVTERTYGAVLAVPVAVRLGGRAVLTVEPVARLSVFVLGFGPAAADGHVAVRLAL